MARRELEIDLVRVEILVIEPDVELDICDDVTAEQVMAVAIGVGIARHGHQPLLIDVIPLSIS